MRKLLTTLCLTIAVLLGSAGESASTDNKDVQFQKIEFQGAVNAAGSRAISESLDVDLVRSGGFNAASIDLDDDGKNELIVHHVHPYWCGSGGCTSYI